MSKFEELKKNILKEKIVNLGTFKYIKDRECPFAVVSDGDSNCIIVPSNTIGNRELLFAGTTPECLKYLRCYTQAMCCVTKGV